MSGNTFPIIVIATLGSMNKRFFQPRWIARGHLELSFIADIPESDERTIEVTKACLVWVCNRTGVFYGFLWPGEGTGPLELGG